MNSKSQRRAHRAMNGRCAPGRRSVLPPEKMRLPEGRQGGDRTAPLHATRLSWWSRPGRNDEYCRKRWCCAPKAQAVPAIDTPRSSRYLFPCSRRRHVSFNVEVYFYVIADHTPTLRNAIVLAIDSQGGVRAQHFSHLAGVRRAFQFKGQVHIFSHALDGERAVGHIVIALFFYGFALEGDLGKFFSVKETGRAQIVVARSVICVDAG